jgi:hypothetical protein
MIQSITSGVNDNEKSAKIESIPATPKLPPRWKNYDVEGWDGKKKRDGASNPSSMMQSIDLVTSSRINSILL